MHRTAHRFLMTRPVHAGPRPWRPAIVLGLLLASSAAMAAFDSGSTGADGDLSPTVNTEIALPPSGVLNYQSINIPAGVTVTFKKNATNTPVHLLVRGDVAIAGFLDLRGQDGRATGTYGDGARGDDGLPGAGGPGGYDGGRGGRQNEALDPAVVRGGAGLGPGGGAGGIEGNDGCHDRGYFKHVGVGGAYAVTAYARGTRYCNIDYATVASAPYGSPLLQPLLGGSGGGGGRGGTSFAGAGGGGGGGAILIAATGAMHITGSIDVTGGDAGGLAGPGTGGHGAGGSGGAIRLVASRISGNGSLYANGGCINNNNARRQYCGSDGNDQMGGAPGRIRLEADALTYNGNSGPAYVVDVPGPVFIAEAPSLRIASIAGQAVPANPTGHADVSLPETATEPVDVVFATTNVPVGNTIRLRVAPAYGMASEVLSPAIGGTTASGNAQVSVTLPAGPSTLQATTSYTVVVAGTLDLSRFARNEPVEKVEVTVSLDGAAQARLVTASGKTFDVPYAVLREAGFRG